MSQPSSEPRVRVATRDEQEAVVDALVLAFVRDPVARFAFSDPTAHRAGFGAFVAAFGGAAFAHGTAFATEGFGGAALWLPPGAEPEEAGVVAAFERWVRPDQLASAFAVMEQMGKLHPPEPHWYLPLIGVDPHCQGRGLGAQLLRHTLALVDRDGLPAYLESTNPANISLYRRHGFEVVERIEVGGAPPLHTMLRPAH